MAMNGRPTTNDAKKRRIDAPPGWLVVAVICRGARVGFGGQAPELVGGA